MCQNRTYSRCSTACSTPPTYRSTPPGSFGAVLGRPRTHPVRLVLLGAQLFFVVRVGVAQLVPGAARPLRHHVGVAGVGLEAVAEVQLDVHPVGRLGQRRRRLAVGVVGIELHRRVVRDVGQFHGQRRFGQRVRAAVGVVDDRERLTPVPLPREQPVPQLVLDAGLPAPVGVQPLGDRLLRRRDAQPVEVVGVHQHAVAGVGRLRNIAARNHFDDRQAELGGELPVALVAAGHRHDRAGAVADQHVVGDEHRNLFPVGRIGRVGAEEHAGLGLVLLALQIGLGRDRRAVGGDRLGGRRRTERPPRVDIVGPLRGGQRVDQLVLGRQHHVGRAEQRVGPGGEHLDVAGVGAEQHRRAGGAADPVALHGLDLVRPVQHFEIVEQPVGVRGDAHHPLPQPFPEHREVAAVAAAVGGDLLVGQHGAQTRAPVDHRVGPVDQPVGVDDVGALVRADSSDHVRPSSRVWLPGLEFGDQLGDRAGLVRPRSNQAL